MNKMNKNTALVFNLITTDKEFSKKANELIKEIKSGKKENKIATWFNLIYDACKCCGFGLYIGERNLLAKNLMNYYGL